MIKKALIIVIKILLFTNLSLSQGNWEQVLPPGPTTNQMASVHFTDESIGISVGERGTILKTTDGGETWHIIEIPWLAFLLDVHFPSPTVGYIVGQDGIILKTLDAGENWVLQESIYSNNLHRVRFRDDDEGWIIGEKGLILYTGDGGENWQQQISGTSENLKDFEIINNNSLCVVGKNETLLLTKNNGENWQPIFPSGLNSEYNYQFKDIYFLNDSIGWLVGDEEQISNASGILKLFLYPILLNTVNGGESWSRIKVMDLNSTIVLPFRSGIEQIHYQDLKNAVCIMGGNGSYESLLNLPAFSLDGGRNWECEFLDAYEMFDFPAYLTPITENKLLLTGYRGEFRFIDVSHQKLHYPNQNCRRFTGVVFGNDGKLMARQMEYQYQSGRREWSVIWNRSEDFGKNWTSFTPQAVDSVGTTFNLVHFLTPQSIKKNLDVWWTLYYPKNSEKGQIYRSADAGFNWHWVSGAVHPVFTPEEEIASLQPEPVFLTPDTLIRFTLKQVGEWNNTKSVLEISYSYNSGKTVNTLRFYDVWNDIIPLQNPFIPHHTRFLKDHFFFDGRTGFLVGSEGNILKTTNTGQSWKIINSGVTDHLWDITFVNSLTGFVVGNFGRILKTDDGGDTWRKTNSGTQEPIYTIAFKNSMEGWVGTETGLRYTTNGGENWHSEKMRYQKGLVRELCFDENEIGYAFTHIKWPEHLVTENHLTTPSNYNSLLVWNSGFVQVEEILIVSSSLDGFKLEQNYPNPFNASTKIEYQLSQISNIELKIYNVHGQLIRSLEKGTKLAGTHTAVWNGLADNSRKVASGIYIYRLKCDGQIKSKKMLLLQ
jgi:photosystem II stability/assembly factor-like uncharacterized protein